MESRGFFSRIFDWPHKGPMMLGLGLLLALGQIVMLIKYGRLSAWFIGGAIGFIGYGLLNLFWSLEDGPADKPRTDNELPSADEYEKAFRDLDDPD